MAFRFPLQTVYHLRKSIEHQHELRLRAANQQVSRIRRGVEQACRRIRELKMSTSGELAAGTTSAELQFGTARERSLDVYRQELERELSRVTELRDQQQRIFDYARREREKLEILLAHQLREFKRQQSRREQRELDNLFLMRRSYTGRG